MTTPFIVWSIISVLFIIGLALRLHSTLTRHSKSRMPVISKGSEREIIYIPGDQLHTDDYNYDEFENL